MNMTEKEIKLAAQLRHELLEELQDNILPYWAGQMTDLRGGFYGRRDGSGSLDADAPKGAVLNARILWTFSAAYRVLRRPEYLETATRAKTRDYRPVLRPRIWRRVLESECRRHSPRH